MNFSSHALRSGFFVAAFLAAHHWSAAQQASIPVAAPLKLVIEKGHDKGITSLVWTRNGSSIVSSGHVRFWNRATGEKLRVLAPQKHISGLLRFSPDGKIMALAGGGHTRLWNAQDGTLENDLPESGYISLAFSPNGSGIAGTTYGSFSHDGDGVVISQSGGELRWWSLRLISMPPETLKSEDAVAGTPLFSPDNRRIAVASDKGLQIWDLRNRRLLMTLAVLPRTEKTPGAQWLAWTPGGFYNGSLNSEQWFHWERDSRVIAASEYISKRSPDKIREALQSKD